MKLSAAISPLIPLLLWCAEAAQTPLYFSLILSFGRYGFNSSVMIPAVEIALERVRETQILPGYRLEYSSVRDSEVRCTAKTNWFKWYIQRTVCKHCQIRKKILLSEICILYKFLIAIFFGKFFWQSRLLSI